MKLATPGLVTLTILFSACSQEPATNDSAATTDATVTATASQPNFLILVADDMGYTDIGAFGSEIRTPSLDGLAQQSMKLTNFHVAPTCAPTRSIFLSGADNHTAGLGSMFGANMLTGLDGQEGYEMYLHERVATIPELLTDAGYHTYIAGKWHLGERPDQSPAARGFEDYFTLLPGSSTQFVAHAGRYEENGERLDTDIEDFYSTEVYTDKLIEYIGANLDDDQPFFAFAAYTSPHWPLQVPDDFIERYAGRYDEGYDVLRRERVQRAQTLGVVPDIDAEAVFRRIGPAWDDLDEETQRISAREMEIYAAMVENLDFHIGRLITFLEEVGELDNTVIVFMSDNGAESDELEINPTFRQRYIESADNSYENLGRRSSFISYGPGWAQASTAPFRGVKGLVNEGGTRVPAFIFDGGGDIATGIDNQYLRVMDLSATLLELAEAELPGESYRGRQVAEMEGRSFTGLLHGNHEPVYDEDEAIGLELHGGKTLRRGRYKLVWEQPPGNTWWPYEIPDTWYRWQLYDIESDPAESSDLSEEEPERLAEMISLWEEFADDHGVVRGVRIRNFERWHPE